MAIRTRTFSRGAQSLRLTLDDSTTPATLKLERWSGPADTTPVVHTGRADIAGRSLVWDLPGPSLPDNVLAAIIAFVSTPGTAVPVPGTIDVVLP